MYIDLYMAQNVGMVYKINANYYIERVYNHEK